MPLNFDQELSDYYSNENDKLLADVRQLHSDLDAKNSTIATLKSENSQLKKDCDALKTEKQDGEKMDEKNAKLQEQYDELKKVVQQQAELRKGSQAKYEQLKQDFDELMSKYVLSQIRCAKLEMGKGKKQKVSRLLPGMVGKFFESCFMFGVS